MRHITRRAALAVAMAVMTVPSLVAQQPQQQKPMTAATPGTVADPTWQGRAKLSDGRVLVTDGAFAIDAAVVKVAKLPDRELPSKVLEDYLKLPHKDECGLNELTAAVSGRTYLTPSGLALSSAYVSYLRRTLGAGSVRFRSGGPLEPIIVLVGGKAVGVLMPVAK